MNVEIGTEASQFLIWEYITGIFVAVYEYVIFCIIYELASGSIITFHTFFIAISVDETSVLQFKIFLACRLPLSNWRSVLRRDLFPSWEAVWRAAGLPGRYGRAGLSRLWVPLRGRDLFPSWETVWRTAGLPGRYGRAGLSRLWVPLRGRDLYPLTEQMRRNPSLQVSHRALPFLCLESEVLYLGIL